MFSVIGTIINYKQTFLSRVCIRSSSASTLRDYERQKSATGDSAAQQLSCSAWRFLSRMRIMRFLPEFIVVESHSQ